MPRVQHLELRELLDMGLDDPCERAERVGAGDRRQRRPGPLRRDGPRDRGIRLRLIGPRDLTDRLRGRRVQERERRTHA